MNAIILAAGMGTRLRPLTNDRPKCLVEVNGIPMVERQIQFLKEKGIEDITLISGYKAEALDFLKERYGVDIVFNDRYDSCNNINSLYIVRDRFHDTYVMEGDVYMDKNVLLSDVSQSTYFAKKKKYENEWGGHQAAVKDLIFLVLQRKQLRTDRIHFRHFVTSLLHHCTRWEGKCKEKRLHLFR